MKRIAIFASGSGSNAENIYNYFENNHQVEIAIIISSSADAYVLERAKNLHVPSITLTKHQFTTSTDLIDMLLAIHIDLIVLAGFLWLVPKNLIKAFPNKIINVHPALLPKFGGKGMYGSRVHQAVKESGETETGITIHYVNEHYDEGNIILQEKCLVSKTDTPDDIASKIHELEFKYFPEVIEGLL